MLGTVREPARDIPVYRRCDVLVVGGGPAGSAAAASAARMGADTLLVERYGHLGGMSTGGLVVWIDRMTDWSGRQVITGFANDLLDRLPADALIGPPDDVWGSRDPDLVEYWRDRAAAFNGTVTWSPTVDPEMLKIASLDLLLDRGVNLLLHSWAVAPVQEGAQIRGIVFESKSGRQAVLADVVIDATGDGDIFALAGAGFETDIVESDIHHTMNVAFRWGGVDMNRYLEFRRQRRDEYLVIMESARKQGVSATPHVMPRNDVALFMRPKFAGYSCLNVDDLTTVEVEGRRAMMKVLDFYRRNLPGFEDAWVLDTAPQIGSRHSRRLVGAHRLTKADWASGARFANEVGVSPPPKSSFDNVSVPLGSFIPADLEGLLAAGRNLSCDAPTHTFMREVPQCWMMGQAAGVAAAIAVDARTRLRDVDPARVRSALLNQGVHLHDENQLVQRVPRTEEFDAYLPLAGNLDRIRPRFPV